jgi:ABC-type nickel/cobalt efflux system permease component RcnA
MLSAIALNRTAFGLVLVVFFSLGLAATLTLLGFLFVYGRKMLNKININPAKKTLFVKIVPVVSAVLIAVLGIIISLDALVKTGIIKG